MKKSYTLRAHHLLCIQGFQGYGYNEKFTVNLKKIVDEIFQSPSETNITLIEELDDACEACPHKGVLTCDRDSHSDQIVKSMDKNVLEKLELENTFSDPAESLLRLSQEKLQTVGDVIGVCDQCTWQPECLWYQSLES